MRGTRTIVTAAGLLLSSFSFAMTLSPRGTGQVLLYPYYTVNRHQQTLVVVTNTTDRGKAVAVRFREAYNGREVLSFTLFLAPYDSWSGAVFSLEDAAIARIGAGIVSSDISCTLPSFAQVTTRLPDGRAYQPFLHNDFADENFDTGPTDDSRTREGSIEIFEMAEVTGDSLASITTHDGAPSCSGLGPQPPASNLSAPTGGLAGAASIVNVAEGIFFPTTATAIDGFFSAPAYSSADSGSPNLSQASVRSNGFVQADIPLNGSYFTLNYPPMQSIDAVSALLMANRVYGNWESTPSLSVQTDWVISFPTKRFYVDPAISAQPVFPQPFEGLFGADTPGRSGVSYGYEAFDRKGTLINLGPVNSGTPPAVSPPLLSYTTQVATFTPTLQSSVVASSVLGSALSVQFPANDNFHSATAGSAVLELTLQPFEGARHELRPSNEGIVVEGLPAIGFEAVNFINQNSKPGILANYSGAYPLQTGLACDQFVDGPPPDSCN